MGDSIISEPFQTSNSDFTLGGYLIFSNCGANTYLGPTYDKLTATYDQSEMQFISMNSHYPGIQLFTVPISGNYLFIIGGAAGGRSTNDDNIHLGGGGSGVIITATLPLLAGQVIKIIIGQMGSNGGGGGGTFITTDQDVPLLIAGGGGGSGNGTYPKGTNAVISMSGDNNSGIAGNGGYGGNGGDVSLNDNSGAAGGAGILSNGINSRTGAFGGSYAGNGYYGGTVSKPDNIYSVNTFGGFGGGGAGVFRFSDGYNCGGGGGGFSGGGGGGYASGGGGAGSYDSTNAANAYAGRLYTSPINGMSAGYNTDQGFAQVQLISINNLAPTATKRAAFIPVSDSNASASASKAGSASASKAGSGSPFKIVNVSNIYTSSVYNFTNCGASGPFGPSLSHVLTSYADPLKSQVTMLNNSEGIQIWTVPISGYYQIIAAGASGGSGGIRGSFVGGKGVIVSTTVFLNANQHIKILVGQKGSTGGLDQRAGGGGGASFVVLTDITAATNIPLLVAGGGGGACGGSYGGASAGFKVLGLPGGNAIIQTFSSTTGKLGNAGSGNNGVNFSGCGGAGFYGDYYNNNTNTNIITSVYAFSSSISPGANVSSGAVPSNYTVGGFGCGGAVDYVGEGAGGGGGYSGGNASTTYNTQAYGGASYDVNGVSNNATLYTASINNNTGGYNVGDGFVQITGLVGAYASGTASASAFASVSGSASASASASVPRIPTYYSVPGNILQSSHYQHEDISERTESDIKPVYNANSLFTTINAASYNPKYNVSTNYNNKNLIKYNPNYTCQAQCKSNHSPCYINGVCTCCIDAGLGIASQNINVDISTDNSEDNTITNYDKISNREQNDLNNLNDTVSRNLYSSSGGNMTNLNTPKNYDNIITKIINDELEKAKCKKPIKDEKIIINENKHIFNPLKQYESESVLDRRINDDKNDNLIDYEVWKKFTWVYMFFLIILVLFIIMFIILLSYDNTRKIYK